MYISNTKEKKPSGLATFTGHEIKPIIEFIDLQNGADHGPNAWPA